MADLVYSFSELYGSEYDSCVTNAKDAKKFVSDSSSIDSSVRLMNYFDDTAFGVGQTNAFKTLSDEFENSIQELTAQINDYVSYANDCIGAVNKAIKKDKDALDAANAAAAKVADVYVGTGVFVDGVEQKTYSEEATMAAKQAEFERVWEEKRWKSPEFKVAR